MPVSFISCASEHVDNLGAYSASRPETGLLIPSGYNNHDERKWPLGLKMLGVFGLSASAAVVVILFLAMVYIDGEDDDPIEFNARIVRLDCPPEDYVGYNYAYGRDILLSAVIHLHESSRSQDTEAIELLERQLIFFRFDGFPNL